MKKTSVLLAILALFIAAGGAIYAKKYTSEKQVTKFVKGLTFKKNAGNGPDALYNPDDMIEIRVKNPNGSFTLEKDDKGIWWLTEPDRIMADPNILAQLPLKIISIEEKSFVEDNPSDLSKYMLDNPDVAVKFRMKGDTIEHGLMFGRRSPTESLYYTYNPEKKRVFLTDFAIKFDLNGSYQAYINKHIFPTNPRKSNRVVFEFPDVTYEFAVPKGETFWMMEKPHVAKVHQRAFPSFLGVLYETEALSTINVDKVPPAADLNNPEVKLSFSRSGEWAYTLMISKVTDNVRYAKLSGVNQIIVIHPEFVEGIRGKMTAIDSVLAVFFPKMLVKKITFTRSGKSITFARDTKESPFLLEGKPDAKVDQAAVWNVILKLADSRNRGYTGGSIPNNGPQYGLDNPRASVQIEFLKTNIVPLTIFYGNTDPTGKFVYSYNTEDPGILMVDVDLVNSFPKSVEALLR